METDANEPDEDTTERTAVSEPSRYDPTTALVVVDVQNDFADPDGNLAVDGGNGIVDAVNTEIAAARAADSLVVYTQDWHPPTTPHFDTHGGVWPVHCVRDTWGAEFHPRLHVVADAPVVRKGVDGSDGYSGFSVRDPVSGDESATELGGILDAADVVHVVVVGLAGDVCVKATALDARARGHQVTVPRSTTRLVDPGALQDTADELLAAGITMPDA